MRDHVGAGAQRQGFLGTRPDQLHGLTITVRSDPQHCLEAGVGSQESRQAQNLWRLPNVSVKGEILALKQLTVIDIESKRAEVIVSELTTPDDLDGIPLLTINDGQASIATPESLDEATHVIVLKTTEPRSSKL